MEAIGCLKALEMAIETRKKGRKLIHHSDRGIQYCSSAYVDVLKQNEIDISMTQSGSPYENGLAERMNGILKNEFYPKRVYQNHKEAVKVLASNIQIYNSKRPHLSLGYLTPDKAHTMVGTFTKSWKEYPKKKRQVF